MLEEKKNKLKEIFSLKSDGNNKKKIENLVVFIIILIITVILINTIWNGDKKKEDNTVESTDRILAERESVQTGNNKTDTIELEQRLETILQNIEGVGKAKVLLTYSESSQSVAMYNEDSTQSDTEETDKRRAEVER